MDRKMIMGVAAVAGIGLLLYMRKSGDQSTLAGSGSLVGLASAASNWASNPIVINAMAKPAAAVSDPVAKSPAPAPAPVPAPSGGASFGGGSFGGSSNPLGFTGIKDGRRTYSDGSSSALTENEMYLYKSGAYQ